MLRWLNSQNSLFKKYSGGLGTYSSPYLISCVEDLIHLSIDANPKLTTNTHYLGDWSNTYFCQTCDIDMSSVSSWSPIGDYGVNATSDHKFDSCHYYGINTDVKISNFTMNSSSNYWGMFGVCEDSYISNLIYKDCYSGKALTTNSFQSICCASMTCVNDIDNTNYNLHDIIIINSQVYGGFSFGGICAYTKDSSINNLSAINCEIHYYGGYSSVYAGLITGPSVNSYNNNCFALGCKVIAERVLSSISVGVSSLFGLGNNFNMYSYNCFVKNAETEGVGAYNGHINGASASMYNCLVFNSTVSGNASTFASRGFFLEPIIDNCHYDSNNTTPANQGIGHTTNEWSALTLEELSLDSVTLGEDIWLKESEWTYPQLKNFTISEAYRRAGEILYQTVSFTELNSLDNAEIIINNETILMSNGAASIALEEGSYNYTITLDGYVTQTGVVNVYDVDVDLDITLVLE